MLQLFFCFKQFLSIDNFKNKLIIIIHYKPPTHKVLYVAVTAPVQQRLHGLQSASCGCHVQDCLTVLQHKHHQTYWLSDCPAIYTTWDMITINIKDVLCYVMLIRKQLCALLDGPFLGTFYPLGWSVIRSVEDKRCQYVYCLQKPST